jgi:hypothetical protein
MLQSDSRPHLYSNYVEKRKKIFFSFYFMFFFNYSFFLLIPKLLQGLFTTWLQVQKHTGVHNLDVDLKTHV